MLFIRPFIVTYWIHGVEIYNRNSIKTYLFEQETNKKDELERPREGEKVVENDIVYVREKL